MRSASPSTTVLFWSYVALMILLFLTAAASGIPSRWLSTTLSLGIATAKALVIGLFFMQLYYRPLRMKTIAVASLLWLALLLGITLSDYLTRGMIQVLGK